MTCAKTTSSNVSLGYASAEYSRSLAEFGTPLQLTASGGWLLARPIPASSRHDACGCYPLFCCRDWQALGADLADLPGDLVAVSLVCDPLSAPPADALTAIFPDICYAYKDHFLTDLRQPLGRFVSPHHQRNARRAARALQIESVAQPGEILPRWNQLYAELKSRHHIEGIAAFSESSFARLMQVPGLHAFTAKSNQEIVGIALWMVHGRQAYYHLAAYSALGYELKASFALFWESFEALASWGVECVSLGGGAGVFSADEGLSRFKRGWSNQVLPAYFCGRILDRHKYQELLAATGQANARFFPAYRAPAQSTAA